MKTRLSVGRQWPHQLKNVVYYCNLLFVLVTPKIQSSKDKIICYDLFFFKTKCSDMSCSGIDDNEWTELG